MCGIFGIGFLSKCKDPQFITQLITELFNEVEIRGTDASGIAFVSNTKIHVIKDGMPGKQFSKSIKFKEACKEMVNEDLLQVIGHCRLKTKGSFLQNVNNHPIVANKVIGVHNGIVTNDDALFDHYNIHRTGRVDTEIIFKLIDYFNNNNDNLINSTSNTIEELHGNFSCAFTHIDKPHILGLFKTYNPTIIRHYVKDNMLIYCSLDTLIENSLNKIENKNLSDYHKFPYESNSMLFINLQTGKFNRVKDL